MSAQEFLAKSKTPLKSSAPAQSRRPAVAADAPAVPLNGDDVTASPSLGRGLQPNCDLEFDLEDNHVTSSAAAAVTSQIKLPTADDIQRLKAKVYTHA